MFATQVGILCAARGCERRGDVAGADALLASAGFVPGRCWRWFDGFPEGMAVVGAVLFLVVSVVAAEFHPLI